MPIIDDLLNLFWLLSIWLFAKYELFIVTNDVLDDILYAKLVANKSFLHDVPNRDWGQLSA